MANLFFPWFVYPAIQQRLLILPEGGTVRTDLHVIIVLLKS